MPDCAGITAVLQTVMMVTVRPPSALPEGLHWPLQPLKQKGC